MTKLRSLLLGVLTLSAAAGCATTGTPVVPAAGPQAASGAAIFAAGETRKLGFDEERFEKVIAPKARPQHLRRQGLLPTSVDNRNFCSPVADQGRLGSCTAFSMGKGLTEYLQRRDGAAQVDVSPLFLYYEERVLRGSVNQDSGATITDGMTVLSKTGVAPEQTWPYDITKFTQKPPSEAYAAAGAQKAKGATSLASFDDVKTAIAAGKPVAFGFRVFSSFRNIGADGVMPMPKPGESVLGGHAVLAVGYDDAKKALVVRNSWSAKWGDQGYFYMPYDNAQWCHDFWTAD